MPAMMTVLATLHLIPAFPQHTPTPAIPLKLSFLLLFASEGPPLQTEELGPLVPCLVTGFGLEVGVSTPPTPWLAAAALEGSLLQGSRLSTFQ